MIIISLILIALPFLKIFLLFSCSKPIPLPLRPYHFAFCEVFSAKKLLPKYLLSTTYDNKSQKNFAKCEVTHNMFRADKFPQP